MTLVENWKDILFKAWSVKTGALAALFTSFQQAFPLIPAGLMGLTLEQSTAISGVFGALGLLFASLVPFVRLFDQGLSK